ncbi:hypothetical protein LR007_00630 [candidate division NPL-UPA2 bacterium]|nr:hypothetical protein [candidate division NPL-UPA2 bacterium]
MKNRAKASGYGETHTQPKAVPLGSARRAGSTAKQYWPKAGKLRVKKRQFPMILMSFQHYVTICEEVVE